MMFYGKRESELKKLPEELIDKSLIDKGVSNCHEYLEKS